MRIKDNKCKCGHDDFFFADKGNQKGIYCSYCGKWLKWADKDEQNLRMKQEDVLDKIRTEIQAMSTDYCGGYIGLDKQEVLKIIDKYRKEQE